MKMCSPICMIFSIPDSYSLLALIGVGFGSAIFGYLLKLGFIEKYRRQTLRLENEMLANHARILSLEKKYAQLQNATKEMFPGKEKANLKVS